MQTRQRLQQTICRDGKGLVTVAAHAHAAAGADLAAGTGAGRDRMAAVTAHRTAVVDPDVDRGGLSV